MQAEQSGGLRLAFPRPPKAMVLKRRAPKNASPFDDENAILRDLLEETECQLDGLRRHLEDVECTLENFSRVARSQAVSRIFHDGPLRRDTLSSGRGRTLHR